MPTKEQGRRVRTVHVPVKSILNIPTHQLGCILGFMQLQAHIPQLRHTVLYLVVFQLKQGGITESGSVRI